MSDPRDATTNPMVKVLNPNILESLMSCSTVFPLETMSINAPANRPRIACQISKLNT